MSDHTVTYRTCKGHRRSPLGGETLERICADCRRLTFRATMAAWGVPVKVPTYKGGYPCALVYAGYFTDPKRSYGYQYHDCDKSDESKLALWIRNATAA